MLHPHFLRMTLILCFWGGVVRVPHSFPFSPTCPCVSSSQSRSTTRKANNAKLCECLLNQFPLVPLMQASLKAVPIPCQIASSHFCLLPINSQQQLQQRVQQQAQAAQQALIAQTTQRLVQQAVQQASQRLQQQFQGGTPATASLPLSAFSALMFPGLLQNGNAAVNLPQVCSCCMGTSAR
jgi:hypothetical protein